jgi:hypothetical protein
MRLIACPWPQFKIGPLLRGEPDKKTYHRLFATPTDAVTGWRKVWLLLYARKVGESEEAEAPGRGPTVVLFRGMAGLFDDILRDHDFVRRKLWEITRREQRPASETFGAVRIGVHVRLGEHRIASPGELCEGRYNVRIPLGWYVNVIQALRMRLGPFVPVRVYCDGTDDELRDLLGLPGVARACQGSALAHLWALAAEPVLVASGSTFSMWASYLGRGPAVWHKGQCRQRLYYDRPEGEVEVGPEGRIPLPFLDALPCLVQRGDRLSTLSA